MNFDIGGYYLRFIEMANNNDKNKTKQKRSRTNRERESFIN